MKICISVLDRFSEKGSITCIKMRCKMHEHVLFVVVCCRYFAAPTVVKVVAVDVLYGRYGM